jgi:hypothetical protein
MARYHFKTSDHPRIKRLEELLLAATSDHTITYAEMNTAIDGDVQNQDRRLLTKALDNLNKLRGLVYQNESDVGYRRLNATEAVEYAGERGLKKTRRAARRGRVRLENVLRHVNLEGDATLQAEQKINTLYRAEILTRKHTVKRMPVERKTDIEDGLEFIKKTFGR